MIFLRQLTDGDALLRMQGGTPALVDKLIEGIDIVSGAATTLVQQQGDQVRVENAAGYSKLFDRVIVATPTNKIEEFLDKDQFATDIELLKNSSLSRGNW